MANNEQKAMELEAQAEKKLKSGSGFLGSMFGWVWQVRPSLGYGQACDVGGLIVGLPEWNTESYQCRSRLVIASSPTQVSKLDRDRMRYLSTTHSHSTGTGQLGLPWDRPLPLALALLSNRNAFNVINPFHATIPIDNCVLSARLDFKTGGGAY